MRPRNGSGQLGRNEVVSCSASGCERGDTSARARDMSRMEGEMEKKGEHMGAGWKTRYFRLEGDKLRYYETKQDTDPKGEINLSTGPTIREADKKHKEQVGPCEILILTTWRTYRLRCVSTTEARKWIHSLKQAVAALADPSSDHRMQRREQSFKRLVREDCFEELSPHVAYRCKWHAAEPNGARVWDSAVRDEVSDAGFLRAGEVVDATGVSHGDTEIGPCLKIDCGYVQLSQMEPVEEMNVSEYFNRLGRNSSGRASSGTAGVRRPSVRMQGLLLLARRVGAGARFPTTFEEEHATKYRLRGCRLEEMVVRKAGAFQLEEPTLEGHVCQVQACAGSEVDVELQDTSGHRYWVTLTAPDAAAAIEWTLALTAGRSPNDDSLSDGTKWLRDTAGFKRVSAPNVLDILRNPQTSTTKTRVDAQYNQPHMRTVSLVVQFCDVVEGGVLSDLGAQPVSARLHALKAPFGEDPSEAYAPLLVTEDGKVRLVETVSGLRRSEVNFSVMPAVNTRWDVLKLNLISERVHLGFVRFNVSELDAAPGHEIVRIVEPPDMEIRDLRWKTVDECDTELAKLDFELHVVIHKLEKLKHAAQQNAEALVSAAPKLDRKADAVAQMTVPNSSSATQLQQEADIMVRVQGETDKRADEETERGLQQEKEKLEMTKQSLEQCRTILLAKDARQIECRITAFFHSGLTAPSSLGASDKFAQLVSVQRYLMEVGHPGASRGSGRQIPDRRNVRHEALLATEQLLVPLSSLEVPIAFLQETIRYRCNELRRQHDALRSHIGFDNGLHRMSAQMSADYWVGMLPLYQECLAFYKNEEAISRPPRALPKPVDHKNASCAVDPHCWCRLLRYWLLQLREVPLFTGDLWVQQDRYDASIRSPPSTIDELNRVLDSIGDENRSGIIRQLCRFLADPMFHEMGKRDTDINDSYIRLLTAFFGPNNRRRHYASVDDAMYELRYIHALVELFRKASARDSLCGSSHSAQESPRYADRTSVTTTPLSDGEALGSEVDDGWLHVVSGAASVVGEAQGVERLVIRDQEVAMEMVRNTLRAARLTGPFFDMSLASLRARDGKATKFVDLCVHMIEKLGGPDADVFAYGAIPTEVKEIRRLKDCLDRYNEPISRAVLKPSSLKKNRFWGFVATNLCVHQMTLTTDPDDAPPLSQSAPAFVAVTSGCAAAHTHGFVRNDLINPPRGKCGIRRMEEKLEELRIEAVHDPTSIPAARTSLERDDWQLKQRGINFLSGIKSKLHSEIWRLKLEGVIYTVHLYQHAHNMSITLYSFAPDGSSSSKLVKSEHNWYGDQPFLHQLADDMPAAAGVSNAVVKFDGHQWSFSVGGDDVNDWLSEHQHAPNDNSNPGFDFGRVQVTEGSISETGDSKHVEYCVQVFRTDGSQMDPPLYKRYSEFEHLVKVINSAVHGAARLNLPPLPSKTVRIQFNSDFVQKRAQALEEWCNRLNDVPRIATNPHFLTFFGLLESSADRIDQFTSPMVRAASSRVVLGQSNIQSSHVSLLNMSQSDVRSRHLDQKHAEITRLSLRIEGRRDVALSQALSILVTSFFATLQSAALVANCNASCQADDSPLSTGEDGDGKVELSAAPKNPVADVLEQDDLEDSPLLSTSPRRNRPTKVPSRKHPGRSAFRAQHFTAPPAPIGVGNSASIMCHQSRQNLRLIERLGSFCISFESLLTTFGKECRMLEDLDATVRLLNGVQLVCKRGQAGARSRCDRIRRIEREYQTTWLHEAEAEDPTEDDDVQENPLQFEPEPEPEHACSDSVEEWCTMQVHVTLAPECFAIIDPSAETEVGDGPECQPESEPILDSVMAEGVPPPSHSSCASTRRLRVRAVLFTQGVNEQQSVAARVGAKRDLGLQDEINRDSVQTMRNIYKEYKHLASAEDTADEIEELDMKMDKLATATNRADGVNTKELDVLVTAASFARSLGCARVTHCKSGKDRTSMSVTLEQCAVTEEELTRRNLALDQGGGRGPNDPKAACAALRDMMRTHGVRREGVRLNTETDLFAFNPAQRAALPEVLQPPVGCYKGMLGGGPAS